MLKGVQQFAVRDAFKSEKTAISALRNAKDSGYDGVEICGFLTRHMPMVVRIFAKMAGMGIGPCGKLDWLNIVRESGLSVISVHEDLNTINTKTDTVLKELEDYKCENVVVTGMYRFDYGNKADVLSLAEDLNKTGRMIKENGRRFFYHNHNCELIKIDGKYALDLLLENTDPESVFFEYDSYWVAETGADPVEIMKKFGNRVKLWHINDRGFRAVNKKTASIRKSDGMELGYGNMPLVKLVEQAKRQEIEAVILENHANWIDGDPIKSMTISAGFLNRNL